MCTDKMTSTNHIFKASRFKCEAQRHPGECLRFPFNTALTHTLKSEISAHQRGQYGHRHTGGGQNSG